MSRLEEVTEDFGVTLKHMADQSYKPLSNGDIIRAMTDEELADFFANNVYTGACNEWGIPSDVHCDGNCRECVLGWIKQPAEVEDVRRIL